MILSYAWHGVLLDDLNRLAYPRTIFLAASSFVYLGIGLIISVVNIFIPRVKSQYKYGLLAGAITGAFVYAVAFLFGIGFYTAIDLRVVAFDLSWQVIEQAVGGVICGWVYRLIYTESKFSAQD